MAEVFGESPILLFTTKSTPLEEFEIFYILFSSAFVIDRNQKLSHLLQ